MNSNDRLNPLQTPLQQKTNFYYPFLLLPCSQREGIQTLYRFCWTADDIADNSDPLPLKLKKLTRFKKNLALTLLGKAPDAFFKDFQNTIQTFHLSSEPLHRIIAGVQRDLKPIRFKKFSELHRYALQVAGGPGIAAMEIFGFKDQAHRNYAENLGVFLQLVNITRDYKEDMALGRQYFPQEDFKRFKVNPGSLTEKNPYWDAFVRFQLDRAMTYLEKARRSLTGPQKSQLYTAQAIAAIYLKLYQKLESHPHRILEGKVSLSPVEKIGAVMGALFQCIQLKQEKS